MVQNNLILTEGGYYFLIGGATKIINILKTHTFFQIPIFVMELLKAADQKLGQVDEISIIKPTNTKEAEDRVKLQF
ncbi:hypothetical protein HID58_061296 [Brassica napus]|uniref:Uncharacterized protein n=1 Tax=Brassica napus TaxID=3708 RepID=A0ABQ7ZY64_BRANA|nr:hypothetical protein HID58_061296 [Brassica napus]